MLSNLKAYLIVQERLKQTLGGTRTSTSFTFVTSNRIEGVDSTRAYGVDGESGTVRSIRIPTVRWILPSSSIPERML